MSQGLATSPVPRSPNIPLTPSTPFTPEQNEPHKLLKACVRRALSGLVFGDLLPTPTAPLEKHIANRLQFSSPSLKDSDLPSSTESGQNIRTAKDHTPPSGSNDTPKYAATGSESVDLANPVTVNDTLKNTISTGHGNDALHSDMVNHTSSNIPDAIHQLNSSNKHSSSAPDATHPDRSHEAKPGFRNHTSNAILGQRSDVTVGQEAPHAPSTDALLSDAEAVLADPMAIYDAVLDQQRKTDGRPFGLDVLTGYIFFVEFEIIYFTNHCE